jgi:hypothetical protein
VNNEPTQAANHAAIHQKFLSGDATLRTGEALLQLLLTFGDSGRDVQPLTRALLARFGDFSKVLDADVDALRSVAGLESNAPTLLKLVDQICRARLTPTPEAQTPSVPDGLEAKTLPPSEYPAPEFTRPVPLTQSEMPLNLPGQSELPLVQKAPAIRERKTIQDVPLAEGLLALKLAHQAKSPEELQEILVKRLGQDSMETRRRYAQSILRWFFPDGLSGLLPRVWLAYQDEAIALDLLRWSYLNQEPILGRCVAEALFPCETGLVISSLIAQGVADRIQRLKDASIAAILKKAADESNRADLKSLLEIIQIADADKLVGVITDDLVTFLRKLLQDANIVHETVALQPILNQIGAVEEERIEESLSKFTSLLRTAIKNAKAKHGAGKRVCVLFRLDGETNA